MTIQQMKLGSAAAVAALTAHSQTGLEYGESNPTPPPAVIWDIGTATFELLNTGIARGFATDGVSFGSGSYTNYPGEWLISGTASQFDALATIVSGTLSSGTTGSWVNLGTSRVWTKNYNGAGASSVVLQIDIRDTATGTILATANQTLTVSRS